MGNFTQILTKIMFIFWNFRNCKIKFIQLKRNVKFYLQLSSLFGQ